MIRDGHSCPLGLILSLSRIERVRAADKTNGSRLFFIYMFPR